MTFQIDRSRILDAQSCPRKRYLGYHFNGEGLQRLNKSLPLVFGAAVHEGLAILVEGKGIDSAVLRSQLELSTAFAAEGVVVEDPLQADLAMREQGALVEGLLRAWELHEGEAFREQFEVIETEQEGRVDLTDGITLMYRPDAVLREKISGDVYVLSWKSCSSYSQMTYNQSQTDMQSLSEVFGVQEKLGERVEGVLYKYLTKGRRSLDDYTGRYVQDSPLIYGWMRPGPTPEETEWAFRYKWPSEEEGRKFQQLGKGFRKVSIWDNYEGGVKQWVEDLSLRAITPRHIDPFEAIFPTSLPISRRADEIESWKRQVVGQETRIKTWIESYAGGPTSDVALDYTFPQSTQRCFDYMSKCQFYDICFNPAVKADPLSSGLYQIRTANHPELKGNNDE